MERITETEQPYRAAAAEKMMNHAKEQTVFVCLCYFGELSGLNRLSPSYTTSFWLSSCFTVPDVVLKWVLNDKTNHHWDSLGVTAECEGESSGA